MRIRTQNLRQQHGILKSVVDAVGGNPTQQKKKDERRDKDSQGKGIEGREKERKENKGGQGLKIK